MRGRARQFRLAVVALVTCAVVATGCSNRPDPLELGLRRVSLDLAFRDAEKATPPDPQLVTQVVEYFDEEFALEEEPVRQTRPRRIAPPRPTTPPCVAAPEGTTPDEPVYAVVTDPPKVGAYRRRNSGTVTIEVPPQGPLTLPYAPQTTWEIPEVTTGFGTLATNPRDQDDVGTEPVADPVPADAPPQVPHANATPEVVRFKIVRNHSRTLKTIDTYQYYLDRGAYDTDTTARDGDGIFLVQRETRSSLFGNTVFTPTPPVLMTVIDVETEATQGAHVGAGYDRETNAAMSVTSKIVGRAIVDVCGTMLDTYVVEFEEQFVDLSRVPPSTSGNAETQKKNVWRIAFDKGLLLVQEEIHSVWRTTVPVSGQAAGVPVALTFDYVSTLSNEEPEPLKPPAAGLSEDELEG